MKLKLIIVTLLMIFNLGLTTYNGVDYSLSNYSSLTSITIKDYNKIIEDKHINQEETLVLYEDYYTESPERFIASATYYGSDEMSYYETAYYGEVIRQQMERGWVLVGSGKFGFHPSMKEELKEFSEKYYPYFTADTLISKQASPLYYYFADGGIERNNRDERNQPIGVLYKDLNGNQKRLFDITSGKVSDHIDLEQYKLSELEAIQSGKYTSIVSAKSPNDLGKRFLIYKVNEFGEKEFYGVVLVAGVAKRADWIGMESTSSDYFRWYNFPLVTRYTDGQHWGFDFPKTIYEWFGGEGGPVKNIEAVDVEHYLTVMGISSKISSERKRHVR